MEIVETQINGATVAQVRVGTTGYKGGDAGHGGRTRFEYQDLNGDVMIKATHGGKGVTVELLGDSELDNLLQGLEFAAATLRKQIDASR
jgi:hypothetical protein